ncbi:MAG TPA: response regulator [Burkholderiales bacterium]|nr:response regulator [Burkholderiales bacterium]
MSRQYGTALPTGLNILVVDDVAATRSLMNWILRQLHCAIIEEAHTGEDAIAAFETLKPDVCFLDIDMPGMDGLEVLQRLREAHKDAFIVIASGCSSVTNVQTALHSGANGFVVKPFSISKVADILLKYTERSVT